MVKNKKTILFVVVAVMVVIMTAGLIIKFNKKDSNNNSIIDSTPAVHEHVDSNNDGKCDSCDHLINPSTFFSNENNYTLSTDTDGTNYPLFDSWFYSGHLDTLKDSLNFQISCPPLTLNCELRGFSNGTAVNNFETSIDLSGNTFWQISVPTFDSSNLPFDYVILPNATSSDVLKIFIKFKVPFDVEYKADKNDLESIVLNINSANSFMLINPKFQKVTFTNSVESSQNAVITPLTLEPLSIPKQDNNECPFAFNFEDEKNWTKYY